jgi:hypothetical protein
MLVFVAWDGAKQKETKSSLTEVNEGNKGRGFFLTTYRGSLPPVLQIKLVQAHRSQSQPLLPLFTSVQKLFVSFCRVGSWRFNREPIQTAVLRKENLLLPAQSGKRRA